MSARGATRWTAEDVVRGLHKSFGTLEVLKGADLEVFPGELVGLIGPSGSGKSSLLHAAGLLEHPTAPAGRAGRPRVRQQTQLPIVADVSCRLRAPPNSASARQADTRCDIRCAASSGRR